MSASVTAASPAVPSPALAAQGWLGPALATNLLWGAWGAWVDVPARNGFPPTLGLIAWTATLIPVVVLMRRGSRPLRTDARAWRLGLAGGVPAVVGNLLVFEALRRAPAHVVFPVVSLYPLVAVTLGLVVLRERLRTAGAMGVVAALIAGPLLAWPATSTGDAATTGGIVLAALAAVLWGLQGFIWKLAEPVLSGDELTAYLLISGVLVAPAALWLTNWRQPIAWGARGFGLALPIAALNAIGVWTYARAMRRGPSIVVVPLTALAPLVTVIVSLSMAGRWPTPMVAAGIGLATVSTLALSRA